MANVEHLLRDRLMQLRWLLACCCILLAGLLPRPAPAAVLTPAEALEVSVKAASIYKFLSYVEWPPGTFTAPNAPFVIGVMNADELADELERITAGRLAGEHPLVIRRVKPGDPHTGQHVLFVGRAAGESLAQVFKNTPHKGLLTISETTGGLGQGSVINFRLHEGRVRFEVSLATAEKNNLKISSRMLPVAILVQSGQS
jgi:hypothetical protein